MTKRETRLGLTALSLLLAACVGRERDVPEAAPMETVDKLLTLHGVQGKLPEDRSAEARRRAVDQAALETLFVDFDEHDPFLANLYVGFVVGVLSRHQQALIMTRKGHRAVLHAGKVGVVMTLVDRQWRIDLGRTVPEVIKKRARAELERVGKARVSEQLGKGSGSPRPAVAENGQPNTFRK